MSLRATILAILGLMISVPAYAQVAPAPGQAGFFVGKSDPLQQGLFNFVAVPVGTVNTATGPQPLEYRFTLPQVLTVQAPVIPTDQTPVPNNPWRIRERVPQASPNRNFLPPSTGVAVARDPRYAFSGRWIPVVEGQTAVAMVPTTEPGTKTFLRVIPRVSGATTGDTAVPHVMPTGDADYALTAANEITLNRGALLVKGSRAPLHILMPTSNDTAVVRVEQGTFAMVSNMDGHVSVANLADSHEFGCRMMLTDRANKTYGEMPVRIGYMLEIYPNGLPAAEHRVASYNTLRQLRLANGLTVETMRLNYVSAFKRFNLTRNLPDSDLQRLVKTAAAVAYMDRGDVL